MLDATDTDQAPWHVVQADDKKRARLNCITHLLGQFPYEDLTGEPVEAGQARRQGQVRRPATMAERRSVPAVY